MPIWFRVPGLDPHMTFPTLAAARAAATAAGVGGPVVRYVETDRGVVAHRIR